ncbi:DMT family transporter [Sulfurirhabdus autotrophica]|uniref:DMT family transporter n=1 Tax=Sulfurirhabdus autotrophica TaxID=1706046 RepID=UPI000F604883|nr:DMT family transporter [Sulfurirhabdus autotrophica]
MGGTAIGVVIGFPFLSTWAMKTIPAAHGAVVVGLLPLVTALFGAWLAGERSRPIFWVSTIVGSITIAFFALSSGGGSFQTGDFLLLGAVFSTGFGYAEGARLSRELGAWQTTSWALVISAPIWYSLRSKLCLITSTLTVGKAYAGLLTSAWSACFWPL